MGADVLEAAALRICRKWEQVTIWEAAGSTTFGCRSYSVLEAVVCRIFRGRGYYADFITDVLERED